MDRLSREEVDEALPQFMALIRAGLTIHIVKSGGRKVYDRAALKDPMALILAILEMASANSYATNLSDRVLRARKRNREEARAGVAPYGQGVCPAWLVWDEGYEWNGRKPSFRPIQHRVAVINEIYTLAALGHSMYFIVRCLNERNEPTWGNGAGWSTSYVSHLLRTPAVLGTFQPKRLSDGRGSKPVPDGEPIRDYYEPVVSAELWQRAQQNKRKLNRNTTGRKGNEYANLFTKACVCGDCSTATNTVTMQIRPTIKRGKKYDYYRCSGSIRGGTANHGRGFDVGAFEQIIFNHLPEWDISEPERGAIEDAAIARVNAEIASVEVRVSDLSGDRDRLLPTLDKATGATADAILSRLDAKLAEIATAEAELSALRDDRAQMMRKHTARRDALTVVARLRQEEQAATGTERAALRERLSIAVKSIVAILSCSTPALVRFTWWRGRGRRSSPSERAVGCGMSST